MRPIIGISCGKAGKHYRASAKVVEVLWEQGAFLDHSRRRRSRGVHRPVARAHHPRGRRLRPSLLRPRPQRDLGVVEPDRDRLEMGLLKGAIARGIPILGICRGCQLLSVAAGEI